MAERFKKVPLKASTAYIVKDTLERLSLNNIKDSRMVVCVLDLLDRAFDFTALENERQRHIELQKKAALAYNEGKATPEQEKLVSMQRYIWWKQVYASLDEMIQETNLVAPEAAVNFVADLLGKQSYDATGARQIMLFADAVEAAPTEVLETKKAA